MLYSYIFLAWSSSARAFAELNWAEAKGDDYIVWDGKDLSGPFQPAANLRPPAWNLTVFDRENLTMGYIFVAPYTHLRPRPQLFDFEPAQIGPAIYDLRGELVWTSAAWLSNRNAYDFKVSHAHSEAELSFVLAPNPYRDLLPTGAGVYLDNSYEPVQVLQEYNGSTDMDMHEFCTTDNGSSALMITARPTTVGGLKVLDNGFVDVDLKTGQRLFEWSPIPYIDLASTYKDWPTDNNPNHRPANIPDYGRPISHDMSAYWDWLHLNSVRKTATGDYIVSARYTSTIYKISGRNGSVVWQLGGKNSSFIHDGFNFSSQHDASIVFEEGDITRLTLLDNAADNRKHTTATLSSALLIELNTSSMHGSLLQRWERPDHQLSYARGNVQVLDNGNVFICWSENGYVSEYTQNGKLVFEGRFASHRFTTYRGYKFNFTGRPNTRPDAVAYSQAHAPFASTTYYASWNGATEVASWRFYGSLDNSTYNLLGQVPRTGFETSFTANGLTVYAYTEALASDGSILGTSVVYRPVDVSTESQGASPDPSEAPDPRTKFGVIAPICSLLVLFTICSLIYMR